MIQVNLFISNFKRYWRKFSIIVLPCMFLSLLFLCNSVLYYMLVDDTNSYTRIMLHELYSQKENIDVLFLGSSHCYRSLDTDITDEIFELNTFNGGSSSQELDGSYALLVEAGKRYNLKKVYLEMYFNVSGKMNNERTIMTPTYIISDYMKPSFNRFFYLINASKSDHWINGFFPARRNWNKLFECQYVSSLLEKKDTKEYRTYEYVNNEDSNEYYAGKGYVASDKLILNNNFYCQGHYTSLAQHVFSEDDVKTLNKIIKYCRRKGIELAFYSAPMSDFYICDIDYDVYIQYVKAFLANYNLPYYDFNLCKEEYFSYDSSLFMDVDHLNKLGAEKFSELFSQFFSGKIKEEDLFYTSYTEKKNLIGNHIYGVIYDLNKTDTGKVISFEVIQNKNFEYYVSIFKKEGTYDCEKIQTLDSSLIVPIKETGQLWIYIYGDKLGENLMGEITMEY